MIYFSWNKTVNSKTVSKELCMLSALDVLCITVDAADCAARTE